MPVILTADGSHTLLSEQYGVSYHSLHGAIDESRLIYIDGALGYQVQRGLLEIRILEIGLGTGLNALLTLIESYRKNLRLFYNALEPFPPTLEAINQLNYPHLLENGRFANDFHLIHSSPWNTTVLFNQPLSTGVGSFTFLKKLQSLEEAIFVERYDVIYFDAFEPKIQPVLWTEEICVKMFDALKPGGVMTTFCAQGAYKRALKRAGFILNALPGPTGKREITQAIKPQNKEVVCIK